MVYDKGGAVGVGVGETRLVTSDGDGKGLCRDWFAILVQFCAYDWEILGSGRRSRGVGDVLPSTRTGVRPR